MTSCSGVDQSREQIGSDDVDRHHLRPRVDAGAVDDGVHAAQTVHVAGEAALAEATSRLIGRRK
jgi:hypothetical protein